MADQNSRSRSQIEADLAAARTRLSANLERLIDEVHPTNVKRRQVEGFKSFVQGEFDNAKDQVQTASGKWRLDRIAMIAGSVAGFVALMAITRAVVRRAQRDGDS
ncbi:DUF3618 domain-containing protein [Enemella evansiae]|uniref:DUF3618 domain-containing protein n=1 Tax=Enemella evansiae TaxID=2016499 RepID=A0A255FYB7_9ACTN|nr:DUF3618 domain-containing protein [Enemella evansiae]PFG66361.1 uncharacterized protein DUF3618 [Propionibacteriaceae bacterium ES.041]OYN94288.1 hypothetical protein CGZ96_18165 [Enemella evansiae]OYO04434.1 hypothetical protein CGZ95_03745 [Enemella evansiae]OYO06302.1 hypothetical protein CGZ97_06615 [Enemella evansiae]OYO07160.1 hypothetical protein CGZ98_19835 [Enemella evansiae]